MTTPGYETFPEIEETYLPENALVHFHFAPHLYDYHFEGAKQLLKAADVYIPEAAGWTREQEKDFNFVAQGTLKPSTNRALAISQGQSAFQVEQATSLYRSQLPVVFADIKAEEIENSIKFIGADDVGDDFEEFLDKAIVMYQSIIETSSHRNPLIVKNLGSAVWRLYRRNKDWVLREQVNILCTLGQNHTPIYDYLTQQEFSSEKVVGSVWVGSNLHMADLTEHAGQNEGSISRKALIMSVIIDALSLPYAKDIIGQKVSLNISPHPYRQPSQVELFTQTLADLIAADIEGNPRLQKSVLSMFTGDIKPGYFAILRKYAAKASELSSI
jgi:hypothetical protein